MAHPAAHQIDPPETDTQREARLVWERARIAEAEEDIAAGRVIKGDEALDWLDRWAAGEELDEPDVG